MTAPAAVGWASLAIGVTALIWVTILVVYSRTRAAVSPREAKSAGYAREPGTSRAAEAFGSGSPNAADAGTEPISEGLGATAPEGAPHTLSGATPDDWAYHVNFHDADALPADDIGSLRVLACGAATDWHTYMCSMPGGHNGRHRASTGEHIVAEWHDPIDLALDGPGFADLAQLDFLEAWRRAGCPAVWPIPVVPGKDAA